jgi:hypothetical protein
MAPTIVPEGAPVVKLVLLSPTEAMACGGTALVLP